MLQGLTNLRSLTLEGVREVVFDHRFGDGGEDEVWRSSTLETLVVTPARPVLTKIGGVANSNIGLCAFFDHIKYLDLMFDIDHTLSDYSWTILLARWKHLETLSVRWHIVGESLSIHRFGAVADNRSIYFDRNWRQIL